MAELCAAAAPADEFTVLKARGRRLTKWIRADGSFVEYDKARTFDIHTVRVPNFDSLVNLLGRLQATPDCAVVRGAIADPNSARNVRRLLHADPSTGDGPTLVEAARRWVGCDLDSLPLPADCDPHDLERCGQIGRSALPEPFRVAAVVVVATAGHTFKQGARLRLWALLDRALTGRELSQWMQGTPCDPSVFRAAQLIYTAAPLFETRVDPLPNRLVVLPGNERVACPSFTLAAANRAPATAAQPHLIRGAGRRYSAAALARAAVAVATAAPGQRHQMAVGQALGLARLVSDGVLTEEEVTRAIDQSLRIAGKGEGEGAAIARWALARRETAGAAQ
jgi:hypothetical protein